MSTMEIEICLIAAAVTAALMTGSLHIRVNLWFYGIETFLIACATGLTAQLHSESSLYFIALLIIALKSCGIPTFLAWTMKKLQVNRDLGTIITPPLAMHGSIVLLALSFLLTKDLPPSEAGSWYGAAAGISLVFTGLILMLTRRLAVSQILGFLVIENGIYVFALTQAHGMPMFVEMGVLLDVLVAVMIAGLLTFKIQKSFEHIDVAKLTHLKD